MTSIYIHISDFHYWRASEASETLSGVTNGNQKYNFIYIYMVRETHFSSTVLGLRNVGGVKCQLFLKHGNHWKRALTMIFKESGCFNFLKLSLLLQRKKAYALPNVVHYKFSLFYRSRKCRVENAVYNCNKLL